MRWRTGDGRRTRPEPVRAGACGGPERTRFLEREARAREAARKHRRGASMAGKNLDRDGFGRRGPAHRFRQKEQGRSRRPRQGRHKDCQQARDQTKGGKSCKGCSARAFKAPIDVVSNVAKANDARPDFPRLFQCHRGRRGLGQEGRKRGEDYARLRPADPACGFKRRDANLPALPDRTMTNSPQS